MGFKTKEMAERIGKSMGNFIKWDKCNESVMGKSFRIRVSVMGKSLFLVQMLGSFDEEVTVENNILGPHEKHGKVM